MKRILVPSAPKDPPALGDFHLLCNFYGQKLQFMSVEGV